jgi:hypothetical protein
MSTRELLRIVDARGLRIELRNGAPVLRVNEGQKQMATKELLKVLKIHRPRIIEILKAEPGRQA